MLQEIEGKLVYVVEFDKMPELPITWEKPEEELYAVALARAIHQGYITEGGKYGIQVLTDEVDIEKKVGDPFWINFPESPDAKYVVYKIIE